MHGCGHHETGPGISCAEAAMVTLWEPRQVDQWAEERRRNQSGDRWPGRSWLLANPADLFDQIKKKSSKTDFQHFNATPQFWKISICSLLKPSCILVTAENRRGQTWSSSESWASNISSFLVYFFFFALSLCRPTFKDKIYIQSMQWHKGKYYLHIPW